MKILVVEDEESSRLSIIKMLEVLGFSAIGCSDGKRALNTLMDNDDIALVITDVQMPEMDGRVLIEKIRADHKYCSVPIIIVSGVVGPKEIAANLMRGATAFLPKPVKLSDIREYLNRYLNRGQE